MAFLAELSTSKRSSLKKASTDDRSAPKPELAGADALEDEAERWKYFFSSGAGSWYDDLRDVTFSSTFCELLPAEARVIVAHWEARERVRAQCLPADEQRATLDQHTADAMAQLQPLAARLEPVVRVECERSAAGLAFVKLSTRSPKDSHKLLRRAELAYRARIEALGGTSAVDDNLKWVILSEEVARAGAVASAAEALELMLDSARVFEDLEYALRGPASASAAAAASAPPPRQWQTSLVARAWDSRLTPGSEFRGIAWGGKLTCLCQYFHPLLFPELAEDGKAQAVERDVKAVFASEAVTSAVSKLDGNCIIDFAWLGPGEVVIIELNPFDGVCLGTFPASTGLFIWDNPTDRAVMQGEAPFEFRWRSTALDAATLNSNCNRDWRAIIHPEQHSAAP